MSHQSQRQIGLDFHSFFRSLFIRGKSYFRGPWFMTPSEVPGTSSRSFYRQELMLSTVQDTSPTVRGQNKRLSFSDNKILFQHNLGRYRR